MDLVKPCEHGNIPTMCRWCIDDLARAGFVPMWSLRRARLAPGKTQIEQEQYKRAKELIAMARAHG